MPQETVKVQEGDTLVSIAHAKGFRSWEVIYLHPANEALRKKRPDPEQLMPGDEVVIPEKKPKEFTLEVNKRHELVVKTLKAHLRLRVGDDEGPYGNCRFTVNAGGKVIDGKTDETGLIDIVVPAAAKEGTLRVWPLGRADSVDWTLQLGHLTPSSEDAGYKARLTNLGYDPGKSDDELQKALLAFQEQEGLEASGALDGPTKSRILERTS
jgi:hypothetical protein